jgi:hypothetical protein
MHDEVDDFFYELSLFVSITSTCVLNYHLILPRAKPHMYSRYLKVARAERRYFSLAC